MNSKDLAMYLNLIKDNPDITYKQFKEITSVQNQDFFKKLKETLYPKLEIEILEEKILKVNLKAKLRAEMQEKMKQKYGFLNLKDTPLQRSNNETI